MVSRQSSHSMTSCPQQIAVPVSVFGGFGEIALAAVTTKNTRMSYRSAIQRWLKDQLQDSIANKGTTESEQNNEPTPFILFLAMTVITNTSDRPNASLVHG